MPAGSIFDTKGSAIFSSDVRAEGDPADTLIGLVALLNSKFAQVLIDTYVGAAENSSRSYGEGVVSRLPVDLPGVLGRMNIASSRNVLLSLSKLAQYRETSQYFVAPAPLGVFDTIEDAWNGLNAERSVSQALVSSLLEEIDSLIADHYLFTHAEAQFVEKEICRYGEIEPACLRVPTLDSFSSYIVSYLIGCVFSRWSLDYSKGSKDWPGASDPFARLPVIPPGALEGRLSDCEIKTTADLALGVSKLVHEIWGGAFGCYRGGAAFKAWLKLFR